MAILPGEERGTSLGKDLTGLRFPYAGDSGLVPLLPVYHSTTHQPHQLTEGAVVDPLLRCEPKRSRSVDAWF